MFNDTDPAVLIEAFGAPVDESTYADGIDIDDIAEAALDELHDTIGVENIETIVTGMNASFTYALQRVTEDHSVFGHIDIDPFYPNVSRRMEEDDLEYREAWKQGYNWRNEKLFVPDEEDDEQTLVGLTVRVGDAGNNGEELLRQSRQHGINYLDINLDHKVDKDAAYGADESDAEATSEDTDSETTSESTTEAESALESAEVAEPDTFMDDSPAVDSINGIGEKFSDRLESAGVETTADLAIETPETLAESVEGVSTDRASEWISAAEEAL